jgi:hypothetical protein
MLMISATNALSLTNRIFQDVIYVQLVDFESPLDATSDIGQYLSRLKLDPSPEEEIHYLRTLGADPNPAGKSLSLCHVINIDKIIENSTIVAIKYLGQIFVATLKAYGIEPDHSLELDIKHLANLPATPTSNTTAAIENCYVALHLVGHVLDHSFEEMLSGTLWFLPTAVSSFQSHPQIARLMSPRVLCYCYAQYDHYFGIASEV